MTEPFNPDYKYTFEETTQLIIEAKEAERNRIKEMVEKFENPYGIKSWAAGFEYFRTTILVELEKK